MNLFRLYSWQLATAGMLLGAFSFSNNFPGTEEDLLDPSLDKPLPQYESTADPGFSESVAQPTPNLNADDGDESSGSVESVTSNSPAVELAPNPLASLLGQENSEAQSAPSDVQPEPVNPGSIKLEPEVFVPQPVIKADPPNEPPAESIKPVLPPSYSSPFDPKPLVRQPAVIKTQPRASVPVQPKKAATAKRKQKQAAKMARQPVVNYDIYRDASVYPTDPRKPNNPCMQGANCGCAGGKTGLHGRPYQPTEPGGYFCGKRCTNKHPQFSVYWPRPFSAKLDEHNPEAAACRYSGCPDRKLTDVFDRLANFRLIDYQRTDNGYCGPESDPYGCLGESRSAAVQSYGVQFVR